MLSGQHGANTSTVEVTNVSSHGFWLLLDDQEYFLAFEHFPWFRDATIAAISHIELQGNQHLYWPDLDVDLTKDNIEDPEKYPLVSRK